MESGPFINDFPIKSSIDSRVSIVILISRGYHYQWEFQDPKVEVLYHTRPYFWGYSPTWAQKIGFIIMVLYIYIYIYIQYSLVVNYQL